MSRFGAISIEHNGAPGALLARAMALETSLGYSLPISFAELVLTMRVRIAVAIVSTTGG